MITTREVKTRKEIKLFLDFPAKLYKGCEWFVPPFYGDEKKMFTKNCPYKNTCEYTFFLAFKDKEVVGRIGVILQRQSNELRKENRVRFTRFDSIDDVEVAKALFNAIEVWALSKGMDTVCGPLGFNDLEREGLLIEGFEQLGTFEEQYNYPYYQKLIEACGYGKEVDWLEHKLYRPDNYNPRFKQLAEALMKKYNLHYVYYKSKTKYINHYKDQIFELLDTSYGPLYQTVPFTADAKKSIISSFKLAIDMDYVYTVADENDKIVCWGFGMPTMSKAVQKSNGKLTPGCIVRLLKAIKHPDVIDLCLIGVRPEYLNTGVAAALISRSLEHLYSIDRVKYFETNLNLENNTRILSCWKLFKVDQNKRRRAFVKVLK